MHTPSRKTLRRAAAVLALTVAGGLTAGAIASPRGGHAMMGGGMPMMMGGHGLERMLDGVDATAEQRTQIRQIAETARKDLREQHEAGRALREQGLALFAQPNVDANAVEALRKQMLAQHDRSSQRMTQAMVDVSRVLTPEQRQRIAERVQKRLEHRHEHQRERVERRGE